tara:strand:+ start:415 stop:882 length:468 start_codon:yes stop_codon:yes gene_type:complete
MSEQVKILFNFHSDIFDKQMVETVWADKVDQEKGFYKIDNIPFYIPLVASEDIVFAEFDETEQMLTYRKTIEYSGRTVVQIVIMDKTTETNIIRDIFHKLGCESEKANEGYFSMEIPADLDYKPIKKELDRMENAEIIGYAEPTISDKHRAEGYN